jgi:2'-5' RNA ligase
MSIAFALRLDCAVASTVSRLQSLLANAAGSEVDTHYSPHITLAVIERDAIPSGIEEAVFAEARTWPRLSLVLTALGIFPGKEPTLFAVPAASVDLIKVHRRLFAILGRIDVHLHFRSKSWTPHVTLTQQAPSAVLFKAALAAWPGPIEVGVCCLDLVGFPPVELLRSEPLTGDRCPPSK